MNQRHLSRRQFIGENAVIGATAAAIALARLSGIVRLDAQVPASDARDLGLINGRIHTMDRTSRVVPQVLIRNGRIAAVGNNVVRRGGGLTVVDLKGRTVIPGLIDAHNHIVLVGNRPGWHTPLEHVLTLPDAIAALRGRNNTVPAEGIISTIGPISAMQFAERRLPNLMELDAVPRAVYLQAAQGGT